MADKEIADRLGLSLRTVRAHMHSAMARLGARTRGEAVLTAVRAGYLALEDAEEESPRARGDRAQATGATRER